jgi:hypothetical protein
MKKILFSVGFILLCFAQILFLVFQTNRGFTKGVKLHVPIGLYDPYDPIKGHYLQLRFNQFAPPDNSLSYYPDLSDDLHVNQEIYCVIARSSETDFKIVDIVSEIPENRVDNFVYLKAQVRSIYNNRFFLRFPFDRYYIQANLALDAENLVRDRDLNPTLIISVDNKGEARREAILIDGLAIEEYVLNQRKISEIVETEPAGE